MILSAIVCRLSCVFFFASIDFGFLSVVSKIREKVCKIERSEIFCKHFQEFLKLHEVTKVYTSEKKSQRKKHTIAEGIFCHSMPC